jgi:hypothetical protein
MFSDYDSKGEMNEFDLVEDEYILVSETEAETAFQRQCATTQLAILRQYQDCIKRLDHLITFHQEEKQSKEDAVEYLTVWRTQVVACYKLFTRFLEHLTSVSPDAHKPDAKITYADLNRAVIEIGEITEKCLTFYRMSVQLVPISETTERIKQAHGSVTEFGRILARSCLITDWRTMGTYIVAFLGPVGMSTLVAFGVGLLFTGWGALILAGGVLAGVVCTKLYHTYHENQILEAERAIEEEKLKLKGFLERWNMIDKTLTEEDIPTALRLLHATQASFDIVCNKLFTELRNPLKLSEACYVCLEALVTPRDFINMSATNVQIPQGYEAQKDDVVYSTRCLQPHMVHQRCWRKMVGYPPLRCGTCRTVSEAKEWQIAFRKTRRNSNSSNDNSIRVRTSSMATPSQQPRAKPHFEPHSAPEKVCLDSRRRDVCA